MKTNDTERPILFSGEMVRALLRDRNPKTQTRRLVKPQPIVVPGWARLGTRRTARAVDGVRFAAGTPRETTYAADFLATYADDITRKFCPCGVPGDRLWVRETWADADSMYQGHTNDVPSVVAYRADKNAIQFDAKKPSPVPSWDLKRWDFDALTWRPSIHMPRWASRITLEVTSVRVERLQDITEEDARAEGVEDRYYRTAFAELWDGINGDRVAWESNPWVWVVGFKRVAAEARLR